MASSSVAPTSASPLLPPMRRLRLVPHLNAVTSGAMACGRGAASSPPPKVALIARGLKNCYATAFSSTTWSEDGFDPEEEAAVDTTTRLAHVTATAAERLPVDGTDTFGEPTAATAVVLRAAWRGHVPVFSQLRRLWQPLTLTQTTMPPLDGTRSARREGARDADRLRGAAYQLLERGGGDDDGDSAQLPFRFQLLRVEP